MSTNAQPAQNLTRYAAKFQAGDCSLHYTRYTTQYTRCLLNHLFSQVVIMTILRSLLSALILNLLTSAAHAVSIGDLELKSVLGERLIAEISLRDTADLGLPDIKVGRANSETYKKLNAEPPPVYQHLKYEVRQANGRYIVAVSSDEPMKEPYLEFILEVKWPTGQAYKSFSVLIDPIVAP